MSTASGLRPISQIAVGELVLAWDETTRSTGYYTVTAVMLHTDAAQVHLSVGGEHVETTPEHPFSTLERGWVAAGDLWDGAHVRRADGSYALTLVLWLDAEPQVMYNLTVATAHTFFVGVERALVHNAGCESWYFGELPNRQGAGKTSGYLVDEYGNRISEIFESGRNKYSKDKSLVRGNDAIYVIQDHVEAQVAGWMRDNNVLDAILVINNHPCSNGINNCNNLLPRMLPLGSKLRVIVPDGFDIRGLFDNIYHGGI
ncbi:hypothetical protein F8S13_23125 [Chloroflexia bacterium SDU3-3]|nr:hypothetical protein F8S13_23125 [Chloroflexia bacterium SDU3-3]